MLVRDGRPGLVYAFRRMTQSSIYRAPFAEGGSHAVDPALATRLLEFALSRGGDYADLFFEYRVGGAFVYDEGILKTASRSVTMGLGVRVVRGDATGFAYTEDFDFDVMKRAAVTAAAIATAGGGAIPAKLTRKNASGRYDLAKVTLDIPGIDKRALLERGAKAAYAEDPSVTKVESSIAEELRELLIVTSDGHMVRDTQPLVRFGIRALTEKNGKRHEGSSGGGGRTTLAYFDTKSPEWHAKQAVAHALLMLDAREAPAGTMEVVLAPGDSGILLHEAVGHGLEADFNRKGTSNYTDQIGQMVASPLCTVVDDARLTESRGAINVDDEGNEPTSTTLIEKGKLVGYMHDRQSAKHFKIAPSGNGRRESFASTPMPRMTNTLLLAGEHGAEEILKTVKRGIFAKKFGGGQVDISNGDFVFSLTESYLVEDGKLTAPLKGVNLIGNGPDVLRKVTMLGNDLETSDGIWTCGKDGQDVPVGVGCPTVKISAITVGGTQIG